jgi:hypothetical protein
MHHGKFTTAPEAVEAHNGEAVAQRKAFDTLSADGQSAVIEFLKPLQVLPPGAQLLSSTKMATQIVGLSQDQTTGGRI